MDLDQNAIERICSYTKFKYDGCYFVLYLPYNYEVVGADITIRLKIKSKIISMDENSLFASIFVEGFEDNKIKSFKNISEYSFYLREKEISLHYIFRHELDHFLNNLFN